MLDVADGKFWKPYDPKGEASLRQERPAPTESTGDTPAGMDPHVYAYRPPIDLTNARLRNSPPLSGLRTCASAARGPTQLIPQAPIRRRPPPAGFVGVMTHQQ